MDFKELADERRLVREVCRKHIPSLTAFKYPEGPSFAVDRSELGDADASLHHVTTTATCIESLADCHETLFDHRPLKSIAKYDPKDPVAAVKAAVIKTLTDGFCEGAASRTWKSEKSAPVYCACRAFPLFLRGTTKWTTKHSEIVAAIYGQLKEFDRFGIGEKILGKKRRPSDPDWYPENAYHTFWALTVADILGSEPFHAQPEASKAVRPGLEPAKQRMRLWIRAKLCEEITLHWANSADLDSDQLTWALAAFLKFEGTDLSSNLRAQDLVRKAFDALASTQEPVGTWRHYRPLFIYSNAGNAYCYVYESFTFLLKTVLGRIQEHEFLVDVMRGFVDRLHNLRKYAEMTQVQLDGKPDTIAWSSGHRPGVTQPEGWATASVFSYFQAYRRLLGVLARRDALKELPKPVLPTAKDPIDVLTDRGDTWPLPDRTNSVAEDLITLFVNPVARAARVTIDGPEPDDQPIRDDQARSAILFGPPGASKTTLAQHVALALGWDYVELHSSHFVVEGVPEVQRTADRLFAYLMELDHAVVLFDEPDELVREREDASDAFGRFLTTSMLPKLAQLWKQQRIIYFLATNHVRYFDAAIIRSERFDVLVLAPPPSFDKKMVELEKRLGKLTAATLERRVTRSEVDGVLVQLEQFAGGGRKPEAQLPREMRSAKLVLLRYDQLEELATEIFRLSAGADPIVLDLVLLSEALDRIADDRLKRLQTYLDYLVDSKQVRRDFQRRPVYSVRNFDRTGEVELPDCIEVVGEKAWLVSPSGACPETVPGYRVTRTGRVGEVDLAPLNAPGPRT